MYQFVEYEISIFSARFNYFHLEIFTTECTILILFSRNDKIRCKHELFHFQIIGQDNIENIEKQQEGSVSWSTYHTYMMGGWGRVMFPIFMVLLVSMVVSKLVDGS